MNNFVKYYHKGNANRTQRINEAMKCVKRANIKGKFIDYAELIDYLRSIMHIEKEILVDDSRGTKDRQSKNIYCSTCLVPIYTLLLSRQSYCT